jgi:hypothetical protein
MVFFNTTTSTWKAFDYVLSLPLANPTEHTLGASTGLFFLNCCSRCTLRA